MLIWICELFFYYYYLVTQASHYLLEPLSTYFYCCLVELQCLFIAVFHSGETNVFLCGLKFSIIILILDVLRCFFLGFFLAEIYAEMNCAV